MVHMENEEKQRLTMILYTILATTLSVGGVLLLGGLISKLPEVTVPAIWIVVISLGLAALTRRGHLTIPRVGLPTLLLGIATYTVMTVDGLHDHSIFLYPALIVSAGLLLGTRGIVLFAVLSVVALTGIGWAEMTGRLITPYSTYVTWFAVLLTNALLIGMTAMLYITIAHLTRSLQQSHRASAALHESETRYRRLVDNAPVGIVSVDAHGQIVDVNPKMAEIVGAPSTAAMRTTNILTFPPLVEAGIAADFRQCLETGIGGVTERFYQKLGSEAVYVRSHGTPIKDAQGVVVGVHAVIEDITDRKSSETQREAALAELQQAKRRMDDIIDFLPEATFVIDRDGQVIAWNRAIELMTGISKSEMLGQGDYAYSIPFYGEKRPILIDLAFLPENALSEAQYQQVQRNGDTLFAEAYVPEVYAGYGAYLWGTASLLRDAAGEIVGAIESIHDITERRQMETALQESRANLMALIENTEDRIWSVDRTFCMIYANERFKQEYEMAFGVRPTRGVSMLDTIPTDSRLTWQARYERALQGEHFVMEEHFEYTNLPAFMEIAFNPIVSNDAIIGVSCFSHDITERKQAEEALRESEIKYRTLVDQSASIVLEWDPDGNILFLNQYGLEFFGFTTTEIVGRKLVGTLVPPVDSTGYDLQEKITHIQHHPDDYTSAENENIRKNGERVWIAWTNKGIYAPDGRLLKTLSIGIDRTRQKQAELALHASEEKWRRFSEYATVGIVVCDEQGNVIEWNPAQERITEIPRERVLNHPLTGIQLELVPPERRNPIVHAAMQTAVNELLRTGQSPRAGKLAYNEIQPLSGQRRIVQTMTFPIPTARGYMMGSIMDDVTVQQQAERRLRDHERLVRQQNQAFVTLVGNETLYTGDLQAAFQIITETAAHALAVQRVSIWFYLPDRSGIHCADLYELDANRHTQASTLYAHTFPQYFAALQTETAIVAEDAHTHPHTAEFSESYLTPLGISSMLDVPLRVAGQMAGVICWEHVGPPRPWLVEEQSFGAAIAGVISTVLETDERLQAEQALRTANTALSARLEELAMLNHITQTVATQLDLPTVLNAVTEALLRLFNASDAFISLLDPVQNGLIIMTHNSRTPNAPRLVNMALPLAPEMRSQVQDRQQPYIIARSHPTAPVPAVHGGLPLHDIQCKLNIPLTSRGKVIGVVTLTTNQPHRTFTPDEMRLAETISGQVAGAIENAHLFEQARRAQEAAESANHAKSVFLANMSHELRTPLNAVLGFTQLMASDANLTDAQRENLGIMSRSGEHLLALINDVLEMSKIEAGRVELHGEDFDLRYMLRGLEEMFRLRAVQKGLRFTFELDNAVPQYIHTDEGKLRQVLINLLSNAVKFTSAGSVTLRVRSKELGVRSEELGVKSERLGMRSEELGTLRLATPNSQLLTRNSRLVFEVEDTGVGIAPEEMSTLFNAFVQTTSGRKSGEGTGLGLPISQQYVRMMGGELHASSAPGRGSLFHFDIPLAPAVSQSPPPSTAPAPRHVLGLAPGQYAPEKGPYRLLVVEDVAANRKLLVDLLKSWRPGTGADAVITVREAVNGQAAVEMWEQWRPHLIWMDIRMPIMDGYEATRRIKASPAPTRPVIVALTAGAFEEERERILAEGCDDFVRKPFQQADICAMLSRHLGLRFVYQEAQGLKPEDTSSDGADPADPGAAPDSADLLAVFRRQPAEWQTALQQAAIQGDTEWLIALAEQGRAQAPQLAAQLLEWINAFDHNQVLDLVERAAGEP